MTDDLVAHVLRYLIQDVTQGWHFQIADLAALGADQVWVRIGLVAVITIAAIAKAELKDLAHLFEQGDRLINCRQAGRGKVGLDPVINLFHAGVPFALSKDPEHGHTLWRETPSSLPYFLDEFLQSSLWIRHKAISNAQSTYNGI